MASSESVRSDLNVHLEWRASGLWGSSSHREVQRETGQVWKEIAVKSYVYTRCTYTSSKIQWSPLYSVSLSEQRGRAKIILDVQVHIGVRKGTWYHIAQGESKRVSFWKVTLQYGQSL